MQDQRQPLLHRQPRHDGEQRPPGLLAPLAAAVLLLLPLAVVVAVAVAVAVVLLLLLLLLLLLAPLPPRRRVGQPQLLEQQPLALLLAGGVGRREGHRRVRVRLGAPRLVIDAVEHAAKLVAVARERGLLCVRFDACFDRCAFRRSSWGGDALHPPDRARSPPAHNYKHTNTQTHTTTINTQKHTTTTNTQPHTTTTQAHLRAHAELGAEDLARVRRADRRRALAERDAAAQQRAVARPRPAEALARVVEQEVRQREPLRVEAGARERGGREPALERDVVDREHDLGVREAAAAAAAGRRRGGALAELLGEQRRDGGRLPVVAVEDVGALAARREPLERGAREEEEAVEVVGRAVEAVDGWKMDGWLWLLWLLWLFGWRCF